MDRTILNVSGIVQYLSFCDWCISLNTMSLRFIHVVHMLEFSSFSRLDDVPLYVYNYTLFIHLSVDGHMDGFHFLALVNNPIMTRDVQTSITFKTVYSWGNYFCESQFPQV